MATTPSSDETTVELEAALRRVEDATAAASFSASSREQARSRARVLGEACGSGPEAPAIAQLAYAAELVSLIAVDLAADPAGARHLIWQLETRAGVSRVALGREVLQTGRLLELPVKVAIEVRLSLLRAFAGARSVALCTRLENGDLRLVSCAGEALWETPPYHEVLRALLSDAPSPRPEVAATRLERLGPSPAILVAETLKVSIAEGELLMAAAAPIISALLERENVTTREPLSSEAVLGSVERRLARLRFDLHDGPQQDVHLLAQDLALFRAQLRPMISGDENAERLLGRLDDLEAQLVALDGDLRRLSTAVQSPLLGAGSLPDALRSVTDAFATRTGIEPQIQLSGDLTELTDSQQIALLSLVREALSNIRKHSAASAVAVTIAADANGIRAEVRDDGTGFDPDETLVLAARAGRLGLVGMHERVRMLGGRTRIDSRLGGPTVISATLPPWPDEEKPASAP